MKRMASIGIVTVVFALVWCEINLRVLGQAASTDAPHIGEGGIPQFAEE